MSTPVGWIGAGKAPSDYEFATDRTQRHSGSASGLIRARVSSPAAFGTLMQEFAPVDYRGHRVRLSGWIKTEGVTGWCGLWMRVDGPAKDPLAFDNMQNRPISGTTDWRRYEVVLDVAGEATRLAFGVILDGPGAAWLDDVEFEITSNDVPTTGRIVAQHPRNLNFEEG